MNIAIRIVQSVVVIGLMVVLATQEVLRVHGSPTSQKVVRWLAPVVCFLAVGFLIIVGGRLRDIAA